MSFGSTSPQPTCVPPAPREPSERARRLVLSFNAAQWIFLCLGLVFLGVGAIVNTVLSWSVAKDLAIDLEARPAQGEIVSATTNTHVRVNGSHPITLRFRYGVAGQSYEGHTDVLHPQFSTKVGAPVELEYSSRWPELAHVKGGDGYWTLFFLAFPLAGLVLTVIPLRSRRRARRAFVDGVPVLASVVFAGPDTSVNVNGRHPFKVKWTFSVEGRSYSGSISAMDPARLAEFAQSREVVVVYLPDSPGANALWVA